MKKRDIFVILGILILASIMLVAIHFMKSPGSQVAVYVDDKVEAVYSLSADGEYEINNGTNKIKIADGEVWMLYANCPDKKCIHEFGKIHSIGETIVCLPNKVVVKVVGEDFKI